MHILLIARYSNRGGYERLRHRPARHGVSELRHVAIVPKIQYRLQRLVVPTFFFALGEVSAITEAGEFFRWD